MSWEETNWEENLTNAVSGEHLMRDLQTGGLSVQGEGMQKSWRELMVGKPGIERSVAKGLCGEKEERCAGR